MARGKTFLLSIMAFGLGLIVGTFLVVVLTYFTMLIGWLPA